MYFAYRFAQAPRVPFFDVPARLARCCGGRSALAGMRAACAGIGLFCLMPMAQAQDATGNAGVNAGVSVSPRIIGGQSAAPGVFPSVLPMLQTVPGRSQFLRQGCAATLIAPNWAITAAHCVFSDGQVLPPDFWSVLPGVNVLSNEADTDRSGEISVVNVFPHPEFDEGALRNDIALLELAEAVNLPTVALYGGPSSALVGVDTLLIGWGVADATDPSNPLFPLDQQFASVPIVSNEVCNAPESYAGIITDLQICAGRAEGGIDACQGDSGGPMIIGIDGFQVQVGIVSFGNGCALPNFYGVYTNVSSYRSWIANFVDVNFLPADPQQNDPGQLQPPVFEGSDNPVPGQMETPVSQADPSGPNPFATSSGSSGGGAASWWLLLGAAAFIGRRRTNA